ncbi:hypothetical protein Kpol_1023p5 [Vanderwaltozyma polyspora DSM 70294]|uniref:Rho-GAP domain-containing protein n=1 Tax=Vanderwaltozyma polyspora (strain ATCC 22028 / DSM 70294 / BCRC 21397 / CBS 2163 / NBRC 10782 / NRRL Y-8283 / UCD 57-17) TaxID=436907 RepID=A7TFM8_VANPO|nr:uncharacterized protein Kpol_1023p5 [Vanderwaltozyma polyspora DSM 70294]EDO18836.1 hypothetical protein Kpol_1023p5 [Vanderwaltozyma polyspora DSM 70294]
MPGFVDNFWSEDLTTGLDVLFERLYHGCEQCNSFIQLFATRMQYEVAYGRQLYGVGGDIDNLDVTGRDPNVSIERALQTMVKSISEEGEAHLTIASNIESLILRPFSKWSNDHRERVKYSEKLLKSNARNFQKSRTYVTKLEKDYFNKCRKIEDFKNSKFNEDELNKAMELLKLQKRYEDNLAREREFQKFATVGTIDFDYKTMRETLTLFLTKLPKSDYKLPLINYSLQNTNSGSEITKFILQNMSLKDMDHAELFGQDLLNLGFLKYCNGVGNTFVNSKKFQYQWKNYAYTFANLPLPGEDGSNSGAEDNEESQYTNIKEINDSSTESENKYEAVTEMPNISTDESTLFSYMKDVEVSDKKYRKESFKMDTLRCSVEELMIDHLSFMEKCELDRIKAIKKATFDFCSILGNKITSLKICVDKMINSEDSIDPIESLLQLISRYHTGVFQPKVISYNNYYNPGAYQIFGIDLETRARLDKKVVPLIVSVILSYMDQIYPDLANDKVRTSIWIAPVKLKLTHELRALLNTQVFKDDADLLEILKKANYDPSTVSSVLKIYLLELPQPLITDEVYDILKVLYEKYPPERTNFRKIQIDEKDSDKKSEDEGNRNDDANTYKNTESENDTNRIRGLYTTLSSLSKPHIATLDAISTHFYRLCKILRMGENGEQMASDFALAISQEFANCIIHVRLLDGNDLGCKIFYDLLTHKKQIFKVLKGQVSKQKRDKD